MPYIPVAPDPNAKPPETKSRVTVSVGASPTRHNSIGELENLEGKTPRERHQAVADFKQSLRVRPTAELGDMKSMTPRQRKDAVAAYKRSIRRG